MDDLVRKIIELDKTGQEKILSLEKQKAELSDHIRITRSDLYKKSKEDTQNIVEKMEREMSKEYQNRLADAHDKARIQEQQNKAFYEANKDKWLSELVNFCIGTEAH